MSSRRSQILIWVGAAVLLVIGLVASPLPSVLAGGVSGWFSGGLLSTGLFSASLGRASLPGRPLPDRPARHGQDMV